MKEDELIKILNEQYNSDDDDYNVDENYYRDDNE